MTAPVITLATDKDGEILTDASGALVTTDSPEVPAFPHLPANIAHALAAFDRWAPSHLDPDGHPHIPASAESWLADNVHAHTHFECKEH